jgi:phosphonate transport system substrate-binding protein
MRLCLSFFLCVLMVWSASADDKVVVALKPDKDPEKMLSERKVLGAFLSEKLGRPVEVIVPLSSAVIIEGLANGTIDIGYLSATDLLNARKAKAASLLLAGEIEGKTSYTSYWVTLKEKPYKDITDLKGRPVAFASRTSTSGYLIPLRDLNQRGLLPPGGSAEAFFGQGNVIFGSGYVSAIERVFAGEAEAAAVSYYVLDKDKHLTPEQRAKLRVLQSQGPVPTHVIAVSDALPAERKAALKAALLALNEEKNTTLRDQLFTSKLVETDEAAHLAPVEEALEVAGRN